MKSIFLVIMTLCFTSSVMAQEPIKQKTGVDVKGCTFFKMLGSKVICSSTWKEGYKANLGKAASE